MALGAEGWFPPELSSALCKSALLHDCRSDPRASSTAWARLAWLSPTGESSASTPVSAANPPSPERMRLLAASRSCSGAALRHSAARWRAASHRSSSARRLPLALRQSQAAMALRRPPRPPALRKAPPKIRVSSTAAWATSQPAGTRSVSPGCSSTQTTCSAIAPKNPAPWSPRRTQATYDARLWRVGGMQQSTCFPELTCIQNAVQQGAKAKSRKVPDGDMDA
mmetsp:Transcript_39504/g.93767  ORF Transcript_39504/g.93767 Transcript_39504/m.93767 type:complete len:224 (-) Transcript_39504:968-1639(-)